MIQNTSIHVFEEETFDVNDLTYDPSDDGEPSCIVVHITSEGSGVSIFFQSRARFHDFVKTLKAAQDNMPLPKV